MSYGWCSIKGNYIPKGECVTLADHEFELNAVTAQRDEALSELITAREDYRQSLLARSFETEQRDRLAEAMRQMRSSGDIVICSQSATNLTTNTQTQPKLIHNGVGIADMYSRDEFENAMKRTNQTIVSDEAVKQNTKNLS